MLEFHRRLFRDEGWANYITDSYLTEWAECSPLLDQSVEETKAKQQLLPDVLLSGAAEEGRVWDGVAEVRAQ